MKATSRYRRWGTALTVLLFFGAAGPAWTQTAGTTPAKSKAAATKPAPAPSSGSANSDYWSINYAAPSRYDTGRADTRRVDTGRADTGRSAVRDVTTEQTGELGRVPLQAGQGTIGVETHSKMSASVPGGTDPYARKESSFTGVSINLPSADKFLAVPVLPSPWSRPE